jgi:hypothetical protein
MSTPRALTSLLLAVAAIGLIACGSDGSPDSTSGQPEPSRGYSVDEQLKAVCKKIGGNWQSKDIRCVFDTDANCVDGKVVAAQLKGFRCVVDPALKQYLDAYDAAAPAREQAKLLAELEQAKEDCLAQGSSYEWIGSGFCIKTSKPSGPPPDRS